VGEVRGGGSKGGGEGRGGEGRKWKEVGGVYN
jgi:hypothetical protein